MSNEQNMEVTPEEEFGKFFDEITGDQPGDGNIPKHEEVVPPAASDVIVEPIVDPLSMDPVAGTGSETGDPINPPAPTPPETDYESLYNKEVQKTKSWDGRIRAANERASIAEAEVHRLTVELNQLREKGSVAPHQSDDVNIADDPELAQFFENYPELVKPFERLVVTKGAEVARKVVEDKFKDLGPRIKTLEEQSKTKVVDDHFLRIERAHPDWEVMMSSGEVTKWIDNQPSFYYPSLTRIIEHGSAEEAIDLLNQVKKSRVSKMTPVVPPTPKKNPEDLIAVPASRAEVPRQEREKDFDYYWTELTKEGKK